MLRLKCSPLATEEVYLDIISHEGAAQKSRVGLPRLGESYSIQAEGQKDKDSNLRNTWHRRAQGLYTFYGRPPGA